MAETTEIRAPADKLGLSVGCVDGEWFIKHVSRDKHRKRITQYLLTVNTNELFSDAQKEFIANTCLEALKKTSWGETPWVEDSS